MPGNLVHKLMGRTNPQKAKVDKEKRDKEKLEKQKLENEKREKEKLEKRKLDKMVGSVSNVFEGLAVWDSEGFEWLLMSEEEKDKKVSR